MNKRWMRALVWTALFAAPACDKGTTGGGDGGSVQPDLGVGGLNEDLSMADMALGKNQMEVGWALLSAFIQGGTNNGYQVDCDKGGISMLTFTATNPMTGKSMMSNAPCPAGANSGTAAIALPDVTGPFTITGVAAGKPMSVGEKIRNVNPASGNTPTIRIYVEGCDQAACQ